MMRFGASLAIASALGILAQISSIPPALETSAYVTLMGACIYAVLALWKDRQAAAIQTKLYFDVELAKQEKRIETLGAELEKADLHVRDLERELSVSHGQIVELERRCNGK